MSMKQKFLIAGFGAVLALCSAGGASANAGHTAPMVTTPRPNIICLPWRGEIICGVPRPNDQAGMASRQPRPNIICLPWRGEIVCGLPKPRPQ